MAAPLNHLKVLDFSRLLPGPYCTWLLADMGADVTRIENPRELEKQARVFGWDRLSPEARRRQREQDMLVRNKRSLMLDIGHEAAREIVLRLASQVDVVVADYRPGVLEGPGLGADDLCGVNPGLIHCSITLCGQTGPLRDKPGHDPIAMAISGAMSRAGDREERPSSVGLAVADVLTGTNAALAILAAHARRVVTGEGARLDIAMTDSAMCLNANVIARYADPDMIPPRHRRRPDTGIWRTRDGGFIATSDMEPRYWDRFCRLVDRPDYAGRQLDPDWHDRIVADLAEIFASKDRAEWEQVLEEAGTQYAPVLSVREALDHPQNRARGMVREFRSTDGDTVRQLGHPAGAELTRDEHRLAVMPGADSRDILGGAGFTQDDIQGFAKSGALG